MCLSKQSITLRQIPTGSCAAHSASINPGPIISMELRKANLTAMPWGVHCERDAISDLCCLQDLRWISPMQLIAERGHSVFLISIVSMNHMRNYCTHEKLVDSQTISVIRERMGEVNTEFCLSSWRRSMTGSIPLY